MTALERRHQERMEREKRAGDQRERRDPTEWRPRGARDTRDTTTVEAVHMRSQPLNHQSLAGFQPGVIEGIEANARGDLIAMMEREGYTVGERGVRVHWQLVVEGYGFPYPEGFIHPEAPDDVQAEGRAAWKRAAEIASDSFQRTMFVALWPLRHRISGRGPQPKALGPGEAGFVITHTSDDGDDVVDAEIVE